MSVDFSYTIRYPYSMKIAISVPDEIFDQVERLTKEYCCSRSQVFTMAVQEFMERHRAKKLLQELNGAYRDEDTREETDLKQRSRSYHVRKMKKDPY